MYNPSYLLQPRFYLMEGSYDVTATVFIDEDMFWVAPLEWLDFISAGLPMLMDDLSPYIFGVLTGEIEVDIAIKHIEHLFLEVAR